VDAKMSKQQLQREDALLLVLALEASDPTKTDQDRPSRSSCLATVGFAQPSRRSSIAARGKKELGAMILPGTSDHHRHYY
jgi:hypothetical protein